MTIAELIEELETIANNVPEGFQMQVIGMNYGDGGRYLIDAVVIERNQVCLK